MNTLTLPAKPVRSSLDLHRSARPSGPARRLETCRLVSLLINQHAGTPFFPELYPEFENFLPAEQALYAVGLRAESGAFTRAGLYAFGPQGPKLVLHADLNREGPGGGTLRVGRRDGNVAPAKLAALNWVLGALVGAQEPGAFDLAPDRLDELLARPIPRKEWAFERTAESCADMFKRFAAPLPLTAADRRLRLPDTLPLLSRDVAPLFGLDDEQVETLPVSPFTLLPAAFRSYALNRFALGLRHATHGFREVKNHFARQFDVAQGLLDERNEPAQLSHLARAIETSKKAALGHLRDIGLSEAERPASMEAFAMAINALRTFSRRRDAEGRVVLYAPGQPQCPEEGRSEADLSAKRTELFARPMLRAVAGYPCQVVNALSDGRFPEDGRELANH